MNEMKKHILVLLGIAVGAISGYIYWKYVGCLTGNCAITSQPVNSTVYGAIMGGILFSLVKREKK